jgi:hypothetical protein
MKERFAKITRDKKALFKLSLFYLHRVQIDIFKLFRETIKLVPYKFSIFIHAVLYFIDQGIAQ